MATLDHRRRLHLTPSFGMLNAWIATKPPPSRPVHPSRSPTATPRMTGIVARYLAFTGEYVIERDGLPLNVPAKAVKAAR